MMSGPSSNQIMLLAAAIAENTAKYDVWLSSQGIATPSFDGGVPEGLSLPHEILEAREAVIEKTAELQALVLGPLGYVQQHMREHNRLLAFQGINRFDIATSFPVNEEASYQQISKVCNLFEPDLKRILRFAMTQHIFKETSNGLVAHTALSRLLAKTPMLRSYIGWVCDEMWPSAARTIDAIAKWPGSQEPNHTGFSIANNTNDTMFTELSRFPDRSSRFANTMSMMSKGEGFGPHFLLEAFPWFEPCVKTFVDIGGSHGRFAIAVAQRYPGAHCIVQDRPDTVAEAKERLPTELKGRVEFMVHDFFNEQPVKGADVYFFRWVFHDWSDKYCIIILQRLVPALKNGARIIVSEIVVPPPGVVPISQEKTIRHMDLAMLELNNSKEREAKDWEDLFQAADRRFNLRGINRPPKSKMSYIEVSWVD